MFREFPNDQEYSIPQVWSTESSLNANNLSDSVAANHHRELHKILVRTLWRNIHPKTSAHSDTPIKVHLEFVLRQQDIFALTRYCNSNNDSENSVSPDLINDIFSEMIRPVVVSSDSHSFQWIIDMPYFWSFLSFCLAFIWLAIIFIRARRLFFILLLCGLIVLIFCQSVYTKYNARLAQKMSVLSQYNGPPDDCKPLHQRSWSQVIVNYFSRRPSNDVCARYYEEVLSEPFLSTSIYEICLELIYQPIVSLSKSLGIALGQFYDSMSAYVPFWIAPFMCAYCVLMGVWAFVKSMKSTEQSSRNRRPRHKVKSAPTPSLTSS